MNSETRCLVPQEGKVRKRRSVLVFNDDLCKFPAGTKPNLRAIRLSTEGKKEASPGFKFLFNNIVNIGRIPLLNRWRRLHRRSETYRVRCKVRSTGPSIAQSVLRGVRRGR